MKKNKKHAEVQENAAPAIQAKRPVFNEIEDLDTAGMTITKSEPAPMPFRTPAPAAQPAPQQQRPYEPEIPVDSALFKPVPGGLQPIIAPKGQVQLNPVVVPVAFVPYSTQNQPMLQYERRPKAAPQQLPKLPEVADQPIEKKTANAAAKRDKAPEFVGEEETVTVDVAKKNKAKNRAFAAILFILTLGFFAIVALSFFAPQLGIANNIISGEPNIINGWLNFSTENLIGQIPLFLMTAACAIALATLIVEFVSLCSGRGYHVWVSYLLMLALTLVVTMLAAFDVLGESTTPLKPYVDGPSVSWTLTFASAALLIVGLIFIPRKAKLHVEDDDDLSDLI